MEISALFDEAVRVNFSVKRPWRRGLPRSWFLIAALTAVFFQAGNAPSASNSGTQKAATNSESKLVAPKNNKSSVLKPAPVNSTDLPDAFRRSIPASTTDLQQIERHIQALVKKVSPAVVAVEVGDGSGSGVVISEDGFVLTAGHVCGEANRNVRFTFPDGKTARGKTLGVDLESDTGLMKITDSNSWPHVGTGELESAHNGDWVLAMGHPGGFDLKRSLVVRLGRLIRLSSNALQTDCTISPGDSGGPLFDMYGRVIGIHSYISSSMADNYHVPISLYYDSWQALLKNEKTTDRILAPEAFVGATGIDESPGCRLTSIDKPGPAYRAGLKVGDVILQIEGKDILVSASFARWIAESAPGDTLNMKVKRGNKSMSFNVKLGALPKKKEPEKEE